MNTVRSNMAPSEYRPYSIHIKSVVLQRVVGMAGTNRVVNRNVPPPKWKQATWWMEHTLSQGSSAVRHPLGPDLCGVRVRADDVGVVDVDHVGARADGEGHLVQPIAVLAAQLGQQADILHRPPCRH